MERHRVQITGDGTIYSETLKSEERIEEFLLMADGHLKRFLEIARERNENLVVKIQLLPKSVLDD